ncbi:hypothetical protein H0H92_012812, partial [Tricholoma furcatifolium]
MLFNDFYNTSGSPQKGGLRVARQTDISASEPAAPRAHPPSMGAPFFSPPHDPWARPKGGGRAQEERGRAQRQEDAPKRNEDAPKGKRTRPKARGHTQKEE